ncbi:MAG: citrate/2-methylcitrate synthase [bacterium]
MTTLFKSSDRVIFWNLNRKAIQRMLDYDYICRREKPSVAVIVHPSSDTEIMPFFFGSTEVIIPVRKSIKAALELCSDVSVLLNFASFRTAFDVCKEALQFSQIKTMMVTAEGIPERFSRQLMCEAKAKKVSVIGPSTVGAITPGALKTGNIGGTSIHIARTQLHRPGSVGLVTRSGGLFNESCHFIYQNADGIAEGVAIGGDRYPGSSFLEHLLRFETNPNVSFSVLLGEVGGQEEYRVIDAIKQGKLTKPIVAWCIGTVAESFDNAVQFGHAGAKANVALESANEKNKALKAAGCLVPETFNDLPRLIAEAHTRFSSVRRSVEADVPDMPLDYDEANKQGKIRKKSNFICTISDDRGEEATYAGVPISDVATPDTKYSIGDVISLLWFKERFPSWSTDFIETVIKLVADHGPAVSGAHNAKVTARAGKDVISSLVTGLLTIGPRFGGAIDGAAKYFKYGREQEMSPSDFVRYMKQQSLPIPGIGHRIKSLLNPDKRVEVLKTYAKSVFPQTELLDYALLVEQETTKKKENLILNVDGCVGVLFVDMFRSLSKSDEEIDHLIEAGLLNAFFVLGRSIGIIGHVLDEKRLGMPMYRHPQQDILYQK